MMVSLDPVDAMAGVRWVIVPGRERELRDPREQADEFEFEAGDHRALPGCWIGERLRCRRQCAGHRRLGPDSMWMARPRRSSGLWVA
jgi:hypothetical protein